MSRLNPFIIPPTVEDDAPRCKFCYSEAQSRDDLYDGICEDCYDALKSRYKTVLADFFEQDELDWLVERDTITAEVSDWLREVAEE